MKILCGADPEVALVNPAGGFVSSIGLVGGTKKAPKSVEGSKVGLTVQEDNVSLEFGFTPVPVDKFSHTVQRVRNELTNFVAKLPGGLEPYYIDSAEYTEKELSAPKAKEFGCDPDYLAYERGAMRPPLDAKSLGRRRFFAGHLHIGYDKSIITSAVLPEWALIQGIEALGYCTYLFDGYDKQPYRRNYYGLPGLYRPKSYGVEWRTPSNAWLYHPDIAELMLSVAEHILTKPGAFAGLYEQIDWDDVSASIRAERETKRGLGRELYQMKKDLFEASDEY